MHPALSQISQTDSNHKRQYLQWQHRRERDLNLGCEVQPGFNTCRQWADPSPEPLTATMGPFWQPVAIFFFR